MPARYEAVRDSLVEKGVPLSDAKTRAAKIYNATRKGNEPRLTKKYDTATHTHRTVPRK
jgi:hypothetical protein